jgi:hypothetical protein
MIALDAAHSLSTVVTLHPHMACINQLKEHVISKGYYLVFTKEWLNNCMPTEEICQEHNSLK